LATIQDIWSTLRDGEQLPYVLLDVAGLERGFDQLPASAFSAVECLFTGDLGDELRDVAPYLARLKSLEPAPRDAIAALMQAHVATLVEVADAAMTFSQLHRHFRKHNLVYSPEGNPLFFRYHDPRVLLDVLKSFDAAQRTAFYGPVSQFTLVDADGVYVRCHVQSEPAALTA